MAKEDLYYIKVGIRRCDDRPAWSRTSALQAGNAGSNPARRILIVKKD
jgi:hypothetical protein